MWRMCPRDLCLILLSLSMDSQWVQFISYAHICPCIQYQWNSTGFHVMTPETFTVALHEVLILPSVEELALRHQGRMWAVQRFSEEEFEKGWKKLLTKGSSTTIIEGPCLTEQTRHAYLSGTPAK